MAEKEVASTGEVVANRPTGPEVEVSGGAQELVRKAPDPVEDGGKIYKVLHPDNYFVVAGNPVVNNEGVRLTTEQADVILPAAKASGVRIVEVEENN